MKLWESSERRLSAPEIDSRLQLIVQAIVMSWPFPEWEIQINRDGGFRTAERQKELFHMDPPMTKTLHSKHMEGKALDLTLYRKGTEWPPIYDRYSYAVLAGYIFTIAQEHGIPLRWGADWNQNWIIKEEKNWEIDFVHWEVE